MQELWAKNLTTGTVNGKLVTEPVILDWAKKYTVTSFVVDSNKRKWRVRAQAEQATKLLACKIGDRISMKGVKGGLCKGAWDKAKRQIVPTEIIRK